MICFGNLNTSASSSSHFGPYLGREKLKLIKSINFLYWPQLSDLKKEHSRLGAPGFIRCTNRGKVKRTTWPAERKGCKLESMRFFESLSSTPRCRPIKTNQVLICAGSFFTLCNNNKTLHSIYRLQFPWLTASISHWNLKGHWCKLVRKFLEC